MRFRITALVVAFATVLPAAVLAGGPRCASEFVAASDCCCDGDEGAESSAPVAPTVNRTCCCEIKRAPTSAAVQVAPAAIDHDSPAPLAATPATLFAPFAPSSRHARTAVLARGPPPARSLYALRVALIC